jgi:HEAT repeat protein
MVGNATTKLVFTILLSAISGLSFSDGAERRNATLADQVQAQLKALSSKDAVTRRKAAGRLGDLGPEAEDAVPALTKLLSDENIYVRAAAARTLGMIHASAATVVPKLVAMLKSDDLRLQEAAAAGCYGYGRDAKAAVPALMELLASPKKSLRLAAVETLGRIGAAAKPSVPGLVRALEADAESQYDVLRTLTAIGPGAVAAVPSITKLLEDKRPSIRRQAAFALAAIGPAAKSAVPKLKARLFKEQRFEQVAFASALWRVNGRSVSVISVLEKALAIEDSIGKEVPRDKEEEVFESVLARLHAARLVSIVGSEAKALLPALIKRLSTKDSAFRKHVIKAIGSMGAEAATAVPALTKELGKRRPSHKSEIIKALGKIGPAAKAAVPLLLDEMGKHGYIEPTAVIAYWRITGDLKKSVALLTKSIASPTASKRSRLVGIEGLGQMGFAARSAVPEMKKLLKDKSPTIRRAARDALSKIK